MQQEGLYDPVHVTAIEITRAKVGLFLVGSDRSAEALPDSAEGVRLSRFTDVCAVLAGHLALLPISEVAQESGELFSRQEITTTIAAAKSIISRQNKPNLA